MAATNDGVPILPEFAGQVSEGEANTAVLPASTFSDTALKVSDMLYQRKKAEAQAQQDKLAQALKDVDYDTVGVYEKDLPELNKSITDYEKWYFNPDTIDKLSKGDADTWTKKNAMKNEISFYIDKSKHDKLLADTSLKLATTDEKYMFDQSNQDRVNDFLNQPLKQRAFGGLQPSIGANYIAYTNDAKKDLPKVVVQGYTNAGGNRTVTEKYTATSLPAIDQRLNNILDTPKTKYEVMADFQAAQKNHPDYTISVVDLTKPVTIEDGQPQFTTIQKKLSEATPKDWLNAHLVRGMYEQSNIETPKGAVTNLKVNVGNEKENTSADERYNFIRDGITTNPENLRSAIIGGKFEKGTITDVQLDTHSGGKGTKSLTIVYDTENPRTKKMESKVYSIPISKDSGRGFQEINNILNQVHEGTKGYVTPEAIAKRYGSDDRFKETPKTTTTQTQPKQTIVSSQDEVSKLPTGTTFYVKQADGTLKQYIKQ